MVRKFLWSSTGSQSKRVLSLLGVFGHWGYPPMRCKAFLDWRRKASRKRRNKVYSTGLLSPRASFLLLGWVYKRVPWFDRTWFKADRNSVAGVNSKFEKSYRRVFFTALSERKTGRSREGRDDANNISCPFHRCNEENKISIANFDYLPQGTKNNGCPHNKDYINFILKRNYVRNFCWVEFT